MESFLMRYDDGALLPDRNERIDAIARTRRRCECGAFYWADGVYRFCSFAVSSDSFRVCRLARAL